MSGGFNPINLVSQVALGVATGGTSIVAQFALQLASQVIKGVISQVAQQLGLPPAVTNAALAAFDGAAGNYAGAAQDVGGMLGQLQTATRANSTQMGEIQGQVDQLQDTVKQMVLDQAVQNGQSSADEDGNRGTARTRAQSGGKAGGGSWLMALAEVLGKKLNDAAETMKADADALDWKDPAEATKFQAETQEFSMLFTTLSTVIKSVGEGEKAMATRQ